MYITNIINKNVTKKFPLLLQSQESLLEKIINNNMTINNNNIFPSYYFLDIILYIT